MAKQWKKSHSRNKSYTPKNKLKNVRGGATMTLFWSRCVKRDQSSINLTYYTFMSPRAVCQQSWTKRAKNFAVSYPQSAYPRVWYRTTPPFITPIVQSGSIIIQPDFGVEGRRGRICSCQCFKELYLDTSIHKATSIFLNIFYQDCRYEDMLFTFLHL